MSREAQSLERGAGARQSHERRSSSRRRRRPTPSSGSLYAAPPPPYNAGMQGSLFLSYSHLDLEWMRTLRRHLEGMLLERVQVWTDESIEPGTSS